MIDPQSIVSVERLRDDLGILKTSLRRKYSDASRQVISEDIKRSAALLAETWLADLSQRPEVTAAVSAGFLGDLSVHFQRLLSFSEHASKRSRYDQEIVAILKRFTIEVVIPLKRPRVAPLAPAPASPLAVAGMFAPTCFVGHSFAEADKPVNDAIVACLESLGMKVVTGGKPKAESISEKVKREIDDQAIFVGVFTRRDKIARKAEWTTSLWVIDEKAYAIGRRKKLILLKEVGVGSIGGIQGDYEFLEFTRDNLGSLLTRIMQLFNVSVSGLR
ncbi:MAG: hypothetical protein ABSF14_14175 [Terriglobia bacterium]|jgi:hypothetical protein